MKSTIFLMLLSFGLQAHAQNSNKQPGYLNLVLTVRKLSAVSYYRLGMPVRMMVNEASEKKKIVKGYITDLEKDKVIIGSFKNNSKSGETFISPDAIEKIRPLSRRGRKIAATVLGGGTVYAVLMGLISKPSPLQYVVFLPAFGAALFFIYYYPPSFLFDLIRQKSKKDGWFFSIEMSP
jgi:hypothetical protein